MMQLFKKGMGIILVVIIASVAYIYTTIDREVEAFIYANSQLVPFHRVGLVLGTSHKTMQGKPNPYFINRIEAAAQLYHQGKIQKILVSGDNSQIYYNEPKAMQEALMEKGVAVEDIVLDSAGFRTLDSVIRAREVFGLEDVLIISQEFHIERAIYIARTLGIDAEGYIADPVTSAAAYRTQLREILARVQAYADVHFLNRQPKFLGDKEEIL